jgi:hypothetical protein
MGKVAELPREKRETFAFYQPLTEEQVKLAERLAKALSEGDDEGAG